MTGLRGDWKKLEKLATAQGWRVQMTGGQHVQWFSPDGKTIVTSALTASDHRAIRNHVSYMRKGGFRDRP